ncbi:DUF6662 family protein [Melioribacteraceae bacterium 4301-Me]|uniref:DUF6662 family protein n=1 Tax=Pyranulibacter aquaticus TaxID=3163344 RepID=UPI00359A3C96
MKINNKLFLFSNLIFAGILISSSVVKADKKYFARSYTSYTLPAGALELEIWQTGRISKGLGYYSRWQPRIEFEYGITDRLTGSMYLNFNEVKSSENNYQSKPFSFSTTSFELRYRLSNPNQWLIDPALYFELAYGGDKVEYEPKILLTKRFDKIISVVNFNSEIERNITESETESAFEITMGVAYELTNNLAVGLEFRQDRGYEDVYGSEVNRANFIGPVVSFQSDKFYIVFNFIAQISGNPASNSNLELIGHEKYELRTILGIEL